MAVRLRLLLMGLAMLAAVLHLLVYHLAPEAPMRNDGRRPLALEKRRQMLDGADRALASAAQGGNLELHFPPGKIRQANAMPFTEVYFSGVYSLYPQRIWIGRDDAIINNADGLFAADVPTPLDWLRQHHTTAVVTVAPPVGADVVPQVTVQTIP